MTPRALVLAVAVSAGACSEPQKASPVKVEESAAAPPIWTEPPREGCRRAGPLSTIEKDPSCVLTKVPDDLRDASRLKITLDPEPKNVTPGGTALLRLGISNPTESEILVVLDTSAEATLPRPDWSRLSGVPEVRPEGGGAPRLHFAVTTLDSHDRNVDGLPMVAPAAGAAAPRAIGIWLKPKGKLVHDLSWWAFRIPAPAPIVKDDAGHRIVPKTAPTPLTPGDYVASVEVPLRGQATVERSVTTTIRVLDARSRGDGAAP